MKPFVLWAATTAAAVLTLGACAVLFPIDPLDPRGEWRSISGQETFLRVDASGARVGTWDSIQKCHLETFYERDTTAAWAYAAPNGTTFTARMGEGGHLIATHDLGGESATRTYRRDPGTTHFRGCSSAHGLHPGLQPGSGLPHAERTWATFEPDWDQ